MLYGTNASTASGDGDDRDYNPAAIPGLASLGAISPQRRPAVITSGGGYGVQGTGGGGAPAGGETAFAGSRAMTYRTSDRNASIRALAAQAKPQSRQAFSKSGRGSKESPMTPSWSGLSGLDFGFGNFVPSKKIRNVAFFLAAPLVAAPIWAIKAAERTAKAVSRPRRSAAASAQISVAPLPRIGPPSGYAPLEGLAGLEGTFSDIGRAFSFNNIGRSLSTRNLTKVGRKAIRYGGVATVTVLSGGFVPQPLIRKSFGLSPGESKISETALKVARGVTVAVAAVATAGAFGYGPAAGGFIYTPPASALPVGTNVSLPMTAASYPGGAGYVAPTTGLTPASASFMGPQVPAGFVPSSVGYGAGQTVPAAESGWLAATGKAAVLGTGKVITAVATQVGAQALIAGLTKKPGTSEQSQQQGGAMTPDYSAPLPAYGATTPAGNPVGGDSSGSIDPIVAGVSPWIGLALAGAGLAVYLGKRNRRKS